MTAPRCIHILGASGSGTTTLGQRLAAHLHYAHLDTDDFFWEPSDPPYHIRREPEQRLTMLQKALAQHDGWVLSGSLCGWGDPLIGLFEAVIFVTLPAQLRLERTRQRERERYGDQLNAGGKMHHKHLEFMAWSAGYDDSAPSVGRSRVRHEAWLAELRCPVIRTENTGAPQDLLAHAVQQLKLVGQ